MRKASRLIRSITMGILCFPVGIVTGLFVSTCWESDDWQYFYVYSGVAAFFVPSLVWLLIVERAKKRSRIRSALAGALGAVFSHYVCWYMILFVRRVSYLLFGSPVLSLNEQPVDLIYAFLGAFGLTFFSLLIFGWITVPAGGAIGFLYEMYLEQSASLDQDSHPDP